MKKKARRNRERLLRKAKKLQKGKEKQEKKKVLLDWLRKWPLEFSDEAPHSKKNNRATFIGTQ